MPIELLSDRLAFASANGTKTPHIVDTQVSTTLTLCGVLIVAGETLPQHALPQADVCARCVAKLEPFARSSTPHARMQADDVFGEEDVPFSDPFETESVPQVIPPPRARKRTRVT
jgi:hypothetical protein